MYNSDLPNRAELPTSRQLLKSTLAAILAAAAILVTIILPAEYGIDPTGVGRALGLAEMGEIKVQLAREAEEDRIRDQQAAPAPERRSSIGSFIGSIFIRPAAAQTAQAARSDEMSVTLKPGQGAEIKLRMKQGEKTDYSWSATGKVNYDLHGDGGGKETSYRKGRGVARDEGTFTAGFDGQHGWFWRNRTNADVTVTVKVKGDYTEIRRLM